MREWASFVSEAHEEDAQYLGADGEAESADDSGGETQRIRALPAPDQLREAVHQHRRNEEGSQSGCGDEPKILDGRQEEPRGDTDQKTRTPGTDRERVAPDREASLRNSVAEQVHSERMAAERHLEVCPEDRHEHVPHGTWVGSPFRIRWALPIIGVEQERNGKQQRPAGEDASYRSVDVPPEEHGNDHGDDQDQQTCGRTASAERAPPPHPEGASCHETGDRGARSEGAPPTEARSQALTGSRRQVEGIKNVPRQDPARRTGDDLGKFTYNQVDRVGPVGVGSS